MVDDEANVRDITSLCLEKRRYQVFTANNAGEALTVAETTEIELVILDVDLGDEDGLDLLATLKSRHPEVSVLMLTGLGFDEDVWQTARERGADGYTSKAMPMEQLFADVRRVLRYRQQFQSAA